MLQLLDTIELRAQMGGMPAYFAQFVFAESDRFPSLLTHATRYHTASSHSTLPLQWRPRGRRRSGLTNMRVT